MSVSAADLGVGIQTPHLSNKDSENLQKILNSIELEYPLTALE